jgi:hypothetical protein
MNDMKASVTYTDRQLRQLFDELEPKRRLQTLKSAFRREANSVRRTAIQNLRASTNLHGSQLHVTRDMEQSIRAVVFKKIAGFRVTIGTKRANKYGKGELGMHINRRGLKKPINIWAEIGTNERYTRSRSKVYVRSRASHPTGRMKRYGYLRKTRDQVSDTVTDNLRSELVNSTIKASKKYGCR